MRPRGWKSHIQYKGLKWPSNINQHAAQPHHVYFYLQPGIMNNTIIFGAEYWQALPICQEFNIVHLGSIIPAVTYCI